MLVGIDVWGLGFVGYRVGLELLLGCYLNCVRLFILIVCIFALCYYFELLVGWVCLCLR